MERMESTHGNKRGRKGLLMIAIIEAIKELGEADCKQIYKKLALRFENLTIPSLSSYLSILYKKGIVSKPQKKMYALGPNASFYLNNENNNSERKIRKIQTYGAIQKEKIEDVIADFIKSKGEATYVEIFSHIMDNFKGNRRDIHRMPMYLNSLMKKGIIYATLKGTYISVDSSE